MGDGLKVRSPKDAVSLGSGDEIGCLDEVLSDMKVRMGLEEDAKVKTVRKRREFTEAEKAAPLVGTGQTKKGSKDGKTVIASPGGNGLIAQEAGANNELKPTIHDDYDALLQKYVHNSGEVNRRQW